MNKIITYLRHYTVAAFANSRWLLFAALTVFIVGSVFASPTSLAMGTIKSYFGKKPEARPAVKAPVKSPVLSQPVITQPTLQKLPGLKKKVEMQTSKTLVRPITRPDK